MPKIKWSAFPNAGDLQSGDIIVGLRAGNNVQLNPVTPEDVQVSLFNYSLATGVNDAFVATLVPPVTSLTDGLLVTLNTGTLTNNTGTPTLQVDAMPAKTIVYNNLQLLPGDLETNNTYVLVYNSNTDTFNLINPSISAANTELVQYNEYNAAIDSGIADAYIANLTPPASSLTGFLSILCKITNANTGASTLTVNGNTAPIVTANNQPLVGGELIANQVGLFLYDSTWASFILVNPSNSSQVKLPVVDDTVARFDGTTGRIQDSLVTINDAGVMSGATQLNVDDVTIDGDTISTNTVNGNLYLEPNGTGHVDVGDPGLETGNILIDGVAFNSRFRVNDIGNVAPAMITIHKHSTTQEPLQISARSNSNTSAHATVTANMPLYSMYATGWLNSYYGIFGQIRFSADSTGTLADGSAPGKLELMVTPDGAVIPVTALSISNAGVTTLANALPVGSGGSGRTTATAYAVICGGTTSTGAQQSVASVGTAGQVLTSNGAGALPTFQTLQSGNIKAWVSFNGTVTPITITGSGNVTSITDGGVGVYTVNFTNALASATYSALATNGFVAYITSAGSTTYSTTACSVDVWRRDSSNQAADANPVCFAAIL